MAPPVMRLVTPATTPAVWIPCMTVRMVLSTVSPVRDGEPGSPSLTGDTVLNTMRTVMQGIQTAGVVAGVTRRITGGAMQASYQGMSRGVGALAEAAGASVSARESVLTTA